MKTVCTIEARMESSRLPGKVLLPVLGRPLLELMIERLRLVREVDEIVIATTSDPSCDAIEALASRTGVACFRGSEEDVLDRVLQAAKSVEAGLIVETTGDCPLIDPQIVSRVIREFKENEVDYCSNVLKPGYPRGMDVQVFPVAVLEEVSRLTSDPHDREHVSIFIYSHPERYRLRSVESDFPESVGDLRVTVDTREDYELVARVFEELTPSGAPFGLKEIAELAERKPEVFDLNKSVRQKTSNLETGR